MGLCNLNRVAWYRFLNLYEDDKAERGRYGVKRG